MQTCHVAAPNFRRPAPSRGDAGREPTAPMSRKRLQPREQAILTEILEYYFEHHEAVSARTLSKISQLSLSPTTIRNLMEDLGEAGYLTSVGGARGRLPTRKAFYIYIAEYGEPALPPRDALPEEATLLADAEAPGLEAFLDRLGAVLAERTGYAAVAALPPREADPLDWVRFVPLPADRLLLSVGTLFGEVWSRVVERPEELDQATLSEAEAFAARRLRGLPLQVARGRIMRGEPRSLLDVAASPGIVFRTLRKAFDWDDAPRWRHWGETRLYRVPELQEPETLLRLHRGLRDPELIGRAGRRGGRVGGALVAIGSELGLSDLDRVSLVAVPVRRGQWAASLGVLGPMHMPYARVLDQTRRATALLERFVDRHWPAGGGA